MSSSEEPAPGFDPARHRAYLEEDLQRHQTFLENLDRDRRRAPFLFLLLVLSIPAGLWLGAFAAVLVVFGTFAVVISAYYLVWGHRTEYQAKIRTLQAELDALEKRSG